MVDFALIMSQEGAETVVTASGELDAYTAPQLRDALMAVIAVGGRRVTVDLAAVEFIDSTAIGELVGAVKKLRSLDGDLALRGPSARTIRVLEITGLTKIFTIRSTYDDAVQGASTTAV